MAVVELPRFVLAPSRQRPHEVDADRKLPLPRISSDALDPRVAISRDFSLAGLHVDLACGAEASASHLLRKDASATRHENVAASGFQHSALNSQLSTLNIAASSRKKSQSISLPNADSIPPIPAREATALSLARIRPEQGRFEG